MAYEWLPPASGTTTTAPRVAVRPRHEPETAHAPSDEPDDRRVAAVIEEFIQAAEEGQAGTRSGRLYRPSALRDLSGALRGHVARDLGHMQLRDVRRPHVQALVDRLAADGLSVSRIRSVVSAIRALYGYALEQGYVEFSPADSLTIPREGPPGRPREPEPAPEVEEARPWASAEPAAPPEPAAPVAPPTPARPAAPPERAGSAGPPELSRGGDYQPIALLPERILSLVLKIAVVLFLLFALVTIAGSV
jgi:hypothetical protein